MALERLAKEYESAKADLEDIRSSTRSSRSDSTFRFDTDLTNKH